MKREHALLLIHEWLSAGPRDDSRFVRRQIRETPTQRARALSEAIQREARARHRAAREARRLAAVAK